MGLGFVDLLLARAAAAQEQINNLLEAEGDDEADDDGGDVDEEVASGVGGVVGGCTSSMQSSRGTVFWLRQVE